MTDFFDGLDRALKLMRVRRGLKQSELAETAKISEGSVSRYENGRPPELPELGKLLVGLGADLHGLQDALDEVNKRERTRRQSAPVDTAELLKLRLQHPGAPQELLVEVAAVQSEARAILAELNKLQRELSRAEQASG